MPELLLKIALFALALVVLCRKAKPGSKGLRVVARLFFSAAALFVLHRVDQSLPALNLPSLSAVSLLGPAGYGLVMALCAL